MYKQILIATDGSESSQRAIHHGVGLAQALHCHVTAISVCRPWSSVAVSEFGFAIAPGEYDRACKAAVERNLRAVKQAANSAAVSCNTIHVTHPNPWQAIIETATTQGCDLIVMASHGRSGIAALLLGSETRKVLTHSKIPVLVHR